MTTHPLKALTVMQPWAWAIMKVGKNIENRTPAWKYRGPLAIHAGGRWSERGGASPLIRGAWSDTSERPLNRGLFVCGAIIGTVELVDVHPDAGCCRPWGESAYVEHVKHSGRDRRQIMHLVLEQPRLLPEPIPCRGALGLWTPPAHVTAKLTGSAS